MLFIYSWVTEGPFTFLQISIIQIAATCINIAVITFNFSLKLGKGGITMSICTLQNLFQLIFEVIIEGRIPKAFEIVAMLCALTGSIMIGLAKK